MNGHCSIGHVHDNDVAGPDNSEFTWVHLFPTVLLSVAANPTEPQRQAALDYLEDQRRASPSRSQKNAFEWVSAPNLHRQPQFAWLAASVKRAANAYFDRGTFVRDGIEITEMWANVSEPGGHHRAHQHPNSWISGVYYLSAPDGCGNISFQDPRPGASFLRLAQTSGGTPEFSLQASVEPETDMMLLFPSWVTHAVGPSSATSDRISVAFNVFPTGELGTPSAKLVHQPATESTGATGGERES